MRRRRVPGGSFPVALLSAVLISWACAHGSGARERAAGAAPASGAAAAGGAPADAASLVRLMYERYQGRWYHTVSFTQRTSRLLPNDSVAAETWYEWAELPGRLRIQQGEAAQGRGALYARDSTFIIRNGAVARRTAGRNPLLLLGFDVYAQAPERTVAQLREDGFDLARFHADTLDGRAVWVVGAAAGDLRSKQFWVEQDRLLFLRLLEPAGNDSTRTQDIRFADYVRAGNGWIAPLVEVRQGGRRVFWEEYSNIRANPPFDPVLFDPDRWQEGVGAIR